MARTQSTTDPGRCRSFYRKKKKMKFEIKFRWKSSIFVQAKTFIEAVVKSKADLHRANLNWANLSGANLDFSCWPLWCRTGKVYIDEKQARQLLAHAFAVAGKFCPPTKKQAEFCNKFRRIQSGEFPRIISEEEINE